MDTEKRKAIKAESKRILDGFSKSLAKVSVKRKVLKEEIGGFREEHEGKECDRDFRERIFANALRKEGDCIVAEEKKW